MKKISILIGFISALSLGAPNPVKLRLALNWKPEPEFGGFYDAVLNDVYKKKAWN